MKWSINSLQVLNSPEPNTVLMSNFTISQDDCSVTYAVNLLPSTSNFTPYDEITLDQAILWTKEALGINRVNAMEAEVQAQIDKQNVITPEPAPLPWGE